MCACVGCCSSPSLCSVAPAPHAWTWPVAATCSGPSSLGGDPYARRAAPRHRHRAAPGGERACAGRRRRHFAGTVGDERKDRDDRDGRRLCGDARPPRLDRGAQGRGRRRGRRRRLIGPSGSPSTTARTSTSAFARPPTRTATSTRSRFLPPRAAPPAPPPPPAGTRAGSGAAAASCLRHQRRRTAAAAAAARAAAATRRPSAASVPPPRRRPAPRRRRPPRSRLRRPTPSASAAAPRSTRGYRLQPAHATTLQRRSPARAAPPRHACVRRSGAGDVVDASSSRLR